MDTKTLESSAGAPILSEEEAVRTHARLVSSLAGRFLYSGQEFDDLYQVGMVGLLRAVRNFDPDRGLCFSTYAVPVILGEIRRYLRDDGSIKVGRSLKENYLLLKRTEQHLSQLLGRSPTLSEVCSECGLNREDALRAMEASSQPVSLETPVGEENDLTLGDRIPEPETMSNVDLLALKEAISGLPPRERQIITLRYFYGKTQRQTADLLQMTQVQVSRQEKKILARMRGELDDSSG